MSRPSPLRSLRALAGLPPAGLRAAVVASLLWPTLAGADGAFPDEQQVFLDPGGLRVVVATNVGLLVGDDGVHFDLVCERHVAAGEFVFGYQRGPDGTLYAAAGRQVMRSSDQGCSWASVDGGLGDARFVLDVFPDPTRPRVVAAVGLTAASGATLYASGDGAASFEPVFTETRGSLSGVEYAASSPGLLYAVGSEASADGGAAIPFIIWSADGGGAWTQALHPEFSGDVVRIAGVDAQDPSTLYLRLVDAEQHDQLAVSHDRGATLQVVLSPGSPLSAFLRAGDGTIYAGTRDGRLFHLAPGAQAFVERPAPHLRCLGERSGILYACGDSLLDHFALATSRDRAATFDPVLRFEDLSGPRQCGTVPADCQAAFEALRAVFVPPDAGPATPPPAAASPRGCHCGGVSGDGLLAWLMLVGTLGSRRRPRVPAAASGS